ncbi:cytochrome b-c1 complex subunit 9, mitochondrial-like isoform X1 [Physcomitrium patens]|uniref:cytochrome b-c1 complex subunit 9, mitochondrial-like isoform X1 n=1 Tax=Physcomitrium patens TaxID=3218 RepID=UPI003CCD9ADC
MGRFQSESVAEQIYRAFTRKNSVYVSVIMIGAIVGERVVSGFVDGCWASHNQGKFYKDIPNLGSLAEEEE